MKRIAKAFFHTLLFLAILLAVDQFLLRVPLEAPGLAETRTFYLDFRSRLFSLLQPSARLPASVEGIIEKAAPAPAARQTPEAGKATPAARKAAPAAPSSASGSHAPAPGGPEAAAPRYLYQDPSGDLQFADSLDEIPPACRKSAQLLGR